MEPNARTVTSIVLGVLGLLFVGFPILFGTWTTVSSQEVAVITRFSAIDRVVGEGFHVKLPYIEDVESIDISTVALPVSELAYSKDAQTVEAEVTVNYAVSKSGAENVYRQYKGEHEDRVVIPAVKEGIKSVLANYTAQGLLDNRGRFPGEIRQVIDARLLDTGISVSNVAVTNLDFDDNYENAVRAKQVAEQQALEQVNVTKSEEEKKKQEILKAEALAERTRLESVALQSANGEKVISKIYAEAALEAAKKWNGQLPTQMIPDATLPFIQLAK